MGQPSLPQFVGKSRFMLGSEKYIAWCAHQKWEPQIGQDQGPLEEECQFGNWPEKSGPVLPVLSGSLRPE